MLNITSISLSYKTPKSQRWKKISTSLRSTQCLVNCQVTFTKIITKRVKNRLPLHKLAADRSLQFRQHACSASTFEVPAVHMLHQPNAHVLYMQRGGAPTTRSFGWCNNGVLLLPMEGRSTLHSSQSVCESRTVQTKGGNGSDHFGSYRIGFGSDRIGSSFFIR